MALFLLNETNVFFEVSLVEERRIMLVRVANWNYQVARLDVLLGAVQLLFNGSSSAVSNFLVFSLENKSHWFISFLWHWCPCVLSNLTIRIASAVVWIRELTKVDLLNANLRLADFSFWFEISFGISNAFLLIKKFSGLRVGFFRIQRIRAQITLLS